MRLFKTVALGLLCVVVVCGSTLAQSSQQKSADTDYESQIKELKEAVAAKVGNPNKIKLIGNKEIIKKTYPIK